MAKVAEVLSPISDTVHDTPTFLQRVIIRTVAT